MASRAAPIQLERTALAAPTRSLAPWLARPWWNRCLARHVWREPGLQRRAPRRRYTAPAHGQRALGPAVEPERVLDVRSVHGRGHERAQAQIGGDEIDRLAQVGGIHHQDRVAALMAPVFPERTVEARGHDEQHVRGREVLLAADEGGRELVGGGGVELRDELERMIAGVVVVDAPGDALHP